MNLEGSDHPTYFYGVTSTNATILSETGHGDSVENRTYPIVLDHFTSNLGASTNAEPSIDFGHAAGPVLLYSDLGQGWIRLADDANQDAAHARAAWKLHSFARHWPLNTRPDEIPLDSDASQVSRIFEFEQCEMDLQPQCDPVCGVGETCFGQSCFELIHC